MRIIRHQFLLAPGEYEPESGNGKITDENVGDVVYAINRRFEVDVPVPLIYNHSEDDNAIPVGIMRDAVKDGTAAFADLHITQDARADRDGGGSKILATVDQIADAISAGSMKLSVEAYRDVKAPAYYGDRTISLEPTAWAILRPGVLPAVPRLVAGHTQVGERVAFALDSLMEAEQKGSEMTIEEAQATIKELNEKIEALEKKLKASENETDKVGELAAALKDAQNKVAELEKEKQETESEAMAVRVKELSGSVRMKLVPGKRDEFDKELAEIDSPAEQLAVLSRMDRVLPELAAEDGQVEASQEDPDASSTARLEAKADKYARENKVSYIQALERVTKGE